MSAPEWVAELNDNFDPRATAIIVYTSILLWFNSNLDREEIILLNLGGRTCWPQRGITRQHDVRICLNFILTRLGWNRNAGANIRTLCFRIAREIHPDRTARSGFRNAYAAAAAHSFIMRCKNYADDIDQTEQLPMPHMLITPFNVDRNIRNKPPSNFEFEASKFARTNSSNQANSDRFNSYWQRIENAWTESVRNEETQLWNNYIFYNEYPTVHPQYGRFVRQGTSSWMLRRETVEQEPPDQAEEEWWQGQMADHFANQQEQDDNDQDPQNEPPEQQPENEPQQQQPENNNADIPNNEPNDLPPPAEQEYDQYDLPKARERASIMEIFHDKYAVIDHISYAQCLGFDGASFTEMKSIPNNLQVQWAEAFSDACAAVNDQLQAPHPNSSRSELQLERRLKWKNILYIIMLRKPPSKSGIKYRDLIPIIRRRFNMYNDGNWRGLVDDYERDVVESNNIERPTERNEEREKENTINQVHEYLTKLQCGRARKRAMSNGIGDHTDPNIIEQMKRKHPARKSPIVPLTNEELRRPRRGIDRNKFVQVLKSLKYDVSAGLGCGRNEHILALSIKPTRQVTPSASNAIDNFHMYANNVVQGQLPDYFYTGYCASRLVPANKVHPDSLSPGEIPECRPINIGSAERRLIERAYFDEGLQASFASILEPVQNGVCVKGGISKTIFGIQAALDANPDYAIFQGDIKNGFNEISRASIIEAVKEQPELHDILTYTYLTLNTRSYVAMGSGIHMTSAGFRVEEGVHQGAVPSGYLYSLGQNRAMQNHRERVEAEGGGVSVILDDNTTLAPREVIFTLTKQLADDLALVGLELQPAKSKAYITEHLRDARWDELRGDVSNGTIEDQEGNTHFGIAACNIPIGTEGFIKAYLYQKKESILKGYDIIMKLLDPGSCSHPDIPTRQMLWILIHVCLQFTGDYWLRHIRPDYTEDFAYAIDAAIRNLIQACIGMNINLWSDIARERMRLPIRCRGLGLRESADRRYAQYIGALAQSIPDLINRTDGNNVIPGRLNIPSLVNMLGEGSFNSTSTNPWEHLLNTNVVGSNNNVANGLRYAWTHLQNNFQLNATPDQLNNSDYLLTQDVLRAGFYHDGSKPKSATAALTIELERARMKSLRQTIESSLPQGHYERASFESWQNISAVPLTSPPDQIGYQDNNCFQMLIARYLGQPNPLCQHLAGRFFGNNATPLDEYGANLSSESLPGRGFTKRHNDLQYLIQDMMRVANIDSVIEPVNFLLGKVGQPYIGDYVNNITSQPGNPRYARHALVPDILATNYPTGTQVVNDSGATRSANALFEIKTFTYCRTRYNHNNRNINPANRRAREVVNETKGKVKKLDIRFAASVVGDGSNGITGPFENALSQFHCKTIIPLCFGAFGEVNEDLDKVIQCLAREAASTDEGLTISPLVNTDRKGGAYRIMLQQFRRAIAVKASNGHSQLILHRLHYVRGTEQEAKDACRSHHSDNRWRPYQRGGYSWFNSHISEGYTMFEQFRNGYYYHMP